MKTKIFFSLLVIARLKLYRSQRKLYWSSTKLLCRIWAISQNPILPSFPISRYLHNYFNLHVCLSLRRRRRRPLSSRPTFEFPIPSVVWQSVTNKSWLVCVKSEKYTSRVTLRPQWDRCCRGEAKVRTLNFKTTWSEFQVPSQTAPAEAKPSCVYSILKPHGQSSRSQVRLLPCKAKLSYV